MTKTASANLTIVSPEFGKNKTTFQTQFFKGNLNLLSDFQKPADLGPESNFSNCATSTSGLDGTNSGWHQVGNLRPSQGHPTPLTLYTQTQRPKSFTMLKIFLR
jgi:hypothetical protein